MNKQECVTKAIVGSVGFIVIGFVCWMLKSGTPLWALILLWLIVDSI